MILKTVISDIGFCVISMNIDVIIMISLARLNFHDFTFSIIKDALTEVIKKASFCLYSNNVSNLALRDKRINVIVIL